METHLDKNFYVPSIEEFFVGFECEWQSKIRQESWNKQICDVDLINIAYDSFEHSDIEEPFNEQFRVKYLDASDIEELGFIDGIKGDYKLIFYAAPRCYCIIYYNPDSKCLFDGIIKNKSELKKVLNMLNIK